ncbi:hypothetical protein [Streptomyces sp. CA2R106]|uniref:hypothetical protein n=1 Tax=Streptomyces sp. CA2R106 TaxID=3120153 RepID=UPI00300A020D
MPRPTHAQVAYGAGTVVLFTFAVLLLTGASSTGAVIGFAALGLLLGVVVAAALRPAGDSAAEQPARAAAPAPAREHSLR